MYQSMSRVLSFESSPNTTPSHPKRRAPVACTACHARKVRCNVVSSGRPCFNCQQDQSVCVLHVSARGRHKRPRKGERGTTTTGGQTTPNDTTTTVPNNDNNHPNTPPTTNVHDEEEPRRLRSPVAAVMSVGTSSTNIGHNNHTAAPPSSIPSHTSHPEETPFDRPSSVEAEDFESNVAGYRHIVDHQVAGHGARTHIYVGEFDPSTTKSHHVNNPLMIPNLYSSQGKLKA